MKTTRSGRNWAYVGAVLHWLYFTPFRIHSTFWLQTLLWVSIAGCVLSLSGLCWGVLRYSPAPRYRQGGGFSRSPYSGLMRWHHYAGLIFGLFSFTWVLSGCLSLDPWNWHPGNTPTQEQAEGVSNGRLQLDSLTVSRLDGGVAELASAFPTRELEVLQVRGELFLLAYRPGDSPPHVIGRVPSSVFSSSVRTEHRLVSVLHPERGVFESFGENTMVEASRAAMPGVAVKDRTWIETHEEYYYDRDGDLPLPVLRVRYNDSQATWLYFDLGRGFIASKEERLTRLNRWLYRGLHSLDFPFLYGHRPIWDVVVILLSLGGVVLAVTTLLPAWRRVSRHVKRLTEAPSPTAHDGSRLESESRNAED